RAIHRPVPGGALKRLLLLALMVLAAACGEKEKEPLPQVTIEQHSVVIFPPGSPQTSAIISVPIEPRRDMTIKFNGRLVWNEDRTVRVFAPFGGRVTEIAVRPGDAVTAGQT